MTPTPARIAARLDRNSPRIAAFRTRMLRWFRHNARSFHWRRSSTSRYSRIVSEVLLQRTRAEMVAPFFPRFIERYPGWKQLAAATDNELRQFLQPIGLWRRRAKSLRALGEEMRRRNGRLPCSRAEIEALPAVGQYVANAILLFAMARGNP